MLQRRVKQDLYAAAEWITTMALLQLTWMLFTGLGLILFGISPATVSLIETLKQRKAGQTSLRKLLLIFVNEYRMNFWKANGMGLFIVLLTYLILTNFKMVYASTEEVSLYFTFGLILIGAVFIPIVLYSFFIYVYFDIELKKVFTSALLVGYSYPLHLLVSVGILFGCYQLFFFVPGLVLFFGISVSTVLLLWINEPMFLSRATERPV